MAQGNPGAGSLLTKSYSFMAASEELQSSGPPNAVSHTAKSLLLPANSTRQADGWTACVTTFLRWPTWFDPVPLNLPTEPFGPFTASKRLTDAGDIVAVATPGHTANHLSILVQDGDCALFVAADDSYNQQLMLARRVDGVSPDERISGATLDAIQRFTIAHPTVYLPTHDPQSVVRLLNRRLAPRRT